MWIPIEGSRDIPLRERHIGQPILWQPSTEQEYQLRQDWEELMDYIVLGKLDQITARIGEVMNLSKRCKQQSHHKRHWQKWGSNRYLAFGLLFT